MNKNIDELKNFFEDKEFENFKISSVSEILNRKYLNILKKKNLK